MASDPDLAVESFGISPDGAFMTVAYLEQVSNLMTADNVPGIERSRGARVQ